FLLQAEDGIRDDLVTGVQTCALPISGVAVRGQHLEDPAAELQDGDVEGAAPEVVDRDRPLLALVEPVGERRRGRLVHEAQHLEEIGRASCREREEGRVPSRTWTRRVT